MKIVINDCYGGFGLSHEAVLLYCKLKGLKVWHVPDEKYSSISMGTYWLVPPEERVKEINWHEATQEERIAHNQATSRMTIYGREIERNDPFLVQVVEQLKEKAGGKCASLKVVEIPDHVQWKIEEYDGNEHVAEVHETWS
jgi:hypothetical protein